MTEDKSKTDITKTKHDPEKANNTKHNITKLAWFSRFLRHSARKRGGLIIQRSQTHTGRKVQEILATRYGTVCHQHMTTMGTFFIITGLTRAIPSCFFFTKIVHSLFAHGLAGFLTRSKTVEQTTAVEWGVRLGSANHMMYMTNWVKLFFFSM